MRKPGSPNSSELEEREQLGPWLTCELEALENRVYSLVTMGRDEIGEAPRSLEAAVQYVAEIERDGTILTLSSAPNGLTVADIVGTAIQRWVAPAARPGLERALTEAFATGESRSFAWVALKSGRSLESLVTPVTRDGRVVHAVLITHDVTERERQQQALRESEGRFHALVQGAFEGLAITIEGKVLVANEALGRMVGAPAEALVGRNGWEFCAPESIAVAREAQRTGDERPYEIVGLRVDGTRFPCDILSRNILYLGKVARLTGFRDLTERKRLERERNDIEEQMRQAQKLESLGLLAGEIAHDFNNVLMAVLANAELAIAAQPTPGDGTGHLDDIRSAALQGRELTRQLLNYAAPGPLTKQPIDLSELVRDTVALIGVSISKKAELSLQLAPQGAVVEGDSGQLRQLILNLVINASEALGDGAGRIEIQIAPVEVSANDLEGSTLTAEILPGPAVMLRIRDTGHGMDEETQRRIFDPFFTTKPTGRGLGLASTLNVVRGHRGAMRVRSEPGSGTEFTVWLKRSEEQPPARPGPPQTGPRGASRGLALVVDDEPMLRSAARKCLLGLGFDVVVAEDGQSALQRFEEHAGKLSLVLLDLTMPQLSGTEVLRRMREREATLPVLCASGYGSAFVAADIASDPAARFLAKPYSFAELNAVIDGLLRT